MGNVSSTVTIEELPAFGTSPRFVRLVGPSLPFMGAEWGGENKLVTTWNPGNSTDATQHNLGPRETSSKWSGDWRRTMMAGTPTLVRDSTGQQLSVDAPDVLRDLLEDIFRTGRRLRVTWHSTWIMSLKIGTREDVTKQSKIVREGRAKSWSFKHRTIHDIEWEIEFEWVGRSAEVPKVTAAFQPNVFRLSQAYQEKIRQVSQRAAKVPQSLTLGQLEAFAKTPSAFATSVSRKFLQIEHTLDQIVDVAKTVASQPGQVTALALDHARNTQAIAKNAVAKLSSIPAELQSTKSTASDFLRSHQTFGEFQDQVRASGAASQDFIAELRKQALQQSGALDGHQGNSVTADPSTVQRIYITKAGDTPKRVSQRMYGNPDNDVDILKANKLSWYLATFDSGKILIIPAILRPQV